MSSSLSVDEGALNAGVVFCEALGADALVYVDTLDNATLMVRRGGDPIDVGTVVGVGLNGELMLAFKESGKAIGT